MYSHFILTTVQGCRQSKSGHLASSLPKLAGAKFPLAGAKFLLQFRATWRCPKSRSRTRQPTHYRPVRGHRCAPVCDILATAQTRATARQSAGTLNAMGPHGSSCGGFCHRDVSVCAKAPIQNARGAAHSLRIAIGQPQEATAMKSAIQTRGNPTRLCPPPESDPKRLTAVQFGLYSPPTSITTPRCS